MTPVRSIWRTETAHERSDPGARERVAGSTRALRLESRHGLSGRASRHTVGRVLRLRYAPGAWRVTTRLARGISKRTRNRVSSRAVVRPTHARRARRGTRGAERAGSDATTPCWQASFASRRALRRTVSGFSVWGRGPKRPLGWWAMKDLKPAGPAHDPASLRAEDRFTTLTLGFQRLGPGPQTPTRMVGHEGLEPSANGLRVRCSAN